MKLLMLSVFENFQNFKPEIKLNSNFKASNLIYNLESYSNMLLGQTY